MTETNPERYLAQLEATIAEIDRLADQERRRRAGREDQRAEAARRGALGADWQDVQRRIDDGRTTLSDVFQGRDKTPAARRLLGLSHQNIERMAVHADLPPEVRADLLAEEAEWDHLRREAGTTPSEAPFEPPPESPVDGAPR